MLEYKPPVRHNWYDFSHDDICWCSCKCDLVECSRNKENRRNKDIPYTAANLSNTELCIMVLKEEKPDEDYLPEV